eukprot:c20290_g1_i1.p1 GENE.c20290_g1_i1~~c20290_g1_i1.p1  ORF type:complete len:470 (+),score=98.14 c20290_g1_i1:36-1412(+)
MDRDSILAQFQSITEKSVDESRQLLELNDWNLEHAIANHFAIQEGNTPDSGIRRARARHTPAAQQLSQVAPQPSPHDPPRPPRPVRTIPRAGAWGLLTFLWGILSWFSALLSQYMPTSVTRFFMNTIGSGIQTATTTPTTQNFSHAFSRVYSGSPHPVFHTGSYRDAQRAARERFQFLLVFLHSDQHFNCPRFCTEVLSHPELISFVDSNFVMWCGDVSNSEAFQLHTNLGGCDFPYLAVVGPIGPGGQSIVVHRMEGLMEAGAVVQALQRVIQDHGMSLLAARLDSEDRVNARLMREEQDKAYQEALKQEQLREQQELEATRMAEQVREEERSRAEEEATRIAREEEDTRLEQLRKHQAKEEKRRALPIEPIDGFGVVSIAVRTQGGRLQRKFHLTDKLQVVKDFVETSETTQEDMDRFCLVMTHPRKVLSDLSLTLSDAGIATHTALNLEELVKED